MLKFCLMFYFYIFLIICLFLISIFYLLRSALIIFTLFSKAPFIPLGKSLILKSLAFLNLKKGDSFVDIGSGDGRVVFTAFKRYPFLKKYVGIEINRILYFWSKKFSLFRKNNKVIYFRNSDALKIKYSSFNKVYIYLLPDLLKSLMKKLEKELPVNSVVVSPIFKIPDEFKKSGNIEVKDVKLYGKMKKIYIWKKK